MAKRSVLEIVSLTTVISVACLAMSLAGRHSAVTLGVVAPLLLVLLDAADILRRWAVKAVHGVLMTAVLAYMVAVWNPVDPTMGVVFMIDLLILGLTLMGSARAKTIT